MTEPASLASLSLSSFDLMWAISATQLLAIAVLLWLHWQARREMEDAINDVTHEAETGFAFLRERLATCKSESDRAYASHRRVSAIERLLRDHDSLLEEIARQPANNDAPRPTGKRGEA